MVFYKRNNYFKVLFYIFIVANSWWFYQYEQRNQQWWWFVCWNVDGKLTASYCIMLPLLRTCLLRTFEYMNSFKLLLARMIILTKVVKLNALDSWLYNARQISSTCRAMLRECREGLTDVLLTRLCAKLCLDLDSNDCLPLSDVSRCCDVVV